MRSHRVREPIVRRSESKRLTRINLYDGYTLNAVLPSNTRQIIKRVDYDSVEDQRRRTRHDGR